MQKRGKILDEKMKMEVEEMGFKYKCLCGM